VTELDVLSERDDFPAFWGSVDVAKLLSQLPDGEAILERGMLGVLNQRIDLLAPDIVVQQLSSMMCRPDRGATFCSRRSTASLT